VLITRLISAGVLAPIVVAVALAGEPWLALVVALVVALALLELTALLDAAGFQPPRIFLPATGLMVAAAVLAAANGAEASGLLGDLLRGTGRIGMPAAAMVTAVILLALACFGRSDPRAAFMSWAVAAFGVAYVGLLTPLIDVAGQIAPAGGSAASVVGPMKLHSGSAWLLLLLAAVWGYDSGAYLIGRWLGRHRLVERISPSKTVEGLAGGLVAATLTSGIVSVLVGLDPWHALLLGPLLGLAAQAGDLAESLVKRAAGRKESGHLVPGHGGILDRIDSFLFAAPVLVAYALLVAGFSL
jgi:phosphatidate cytidylyltransferase